MRFSLAVAAVAAIAPVLYVSAQKNYVVLVGDGETLTYSPSNITAAQGDTVSFQFTSKNHSVTQSSFAAPCTRLPGGVDSLFQLVPAGATQLPEWTITINNASAPLWFFCAQTIPADHCAAGMVFSINATPLKTFDAFQAAAKLTGTTASGASSGATSAGAASDTAGAVGATGAASTGGAVGATGVSSAGAAGATGAVGNTAGAAGATGAATTTTAGGSSSGSNTSSSSTPSNGALRTGGSAAGVLTFVGFVAGLIL